MANGINTRKFGLKLDFTNVMVTTVLALVLFQAFGLIFGKGLGLDIALGPVFILLPLAASGALAVVIVKKMTMGQTITRQDWFAIAVTTMLALLFLFFLRDLVPEIFSGSIIELQSLVGFN